MLQVAWLGFGGILTGIATGFRACPPTLMIRTYPMSKFVVEEGFGMAVADLSVVFFVCSQLRI